MKKIYSLLFILTIIGLTFSSCKKEDKKEVTPTFSVVANWKTTSVNREYFLKDISTGVKYNMLLSDYVDHINFNADGTGDMTVSGVVIRKFNYTSTSTDIHFSSVFSYDGKKWVSSPSFMFFITSLSNTQMTFTEQDYYYDHPSEQGKEYDKVVFNVAVAKD